MRSNSEPIARHYYNDGTVENYLLKEKITEFDSTRSFYVFSVIPMGAVRMTQSDRWKTDPNHFDVKKRQRMAVFNYFNFKNILQLQAKELGYVLGDSLDAVFFIPMPKTWSDKKKREMSGTICKQKPDIDNLVKSVCDTLKKEDKDVWFVKAEKRWSYKGCILIYKTA